MSTFLVAPLHFGRRSETLRETAAQTVGLFFAVFSTQTVFSLSWAVRLNTFAIYFCMMSLTEARRVFFCGSFFGSWAEFIAEGWVQNKYLSAVQGCQKIESQPANPSVLHEHFPPVETVIGSMCQRQDGWVDQLPHPGLSHFFTSTKAQVRNLYKDKTDVQVIIKQQMRIEIKEASKLKQKSWPFGPLGQSPWRFGGWGLVFGECKPPERKHGPQSAPCFLCERGREHTTTFHR